MIDVSTAVRLLSRELPKPVSVRKSLSEAVGHVVSKDIRSRNASPVFDQSAVDGYVLLNGPYTDDSSLPVVGEIKAGDAAPVSGRRRVAYRIFTGAPVPRAAWSVVMQEKVIAEKDNVHVPASALVAGSNIRRKANHFGKGDLILHRGSRLNAAAIGLLAAAGISEVDVFRKPRVAIIVTGNELVPPGKALSPGKIHESNSFALRAALQDAGFAVSFIATAVDRPGALDRSLVRSMRSADVILLTGGISVGKYDLVHEALTKAGVREIFYKVAQKPGKPLYAGRKREKMFFALPGNPAAVLVCFHKYVLPSLKRISGTAVTESVPFRLPLANSHEVKGDRDLFLRAKTDNGSVKILSGQDSDNLLSFAQADALVYLSRETRTYRRGDPVEVILLGSSGHFNF